MDIAEISQLNPTERKAFAIAAAGDLSPEDQGDIVKSLMPPTQKRPTTSG
jgi:hypothetical protein